MLKKVLSIMLALAMCATLVVVPVSADATGTVLFEEDFSDATAAIARFEQYGPNTGTDTFLVKEFWGTKATEGASLNFTGSSNGHKFDINAPRAAIADSNWSDFRLEFDYTTGPVANSYVMLRMDENYNGIEIQLGAGTGTAYTYELVNGISTMTAGVAKYDHWGNITYGEAAYRNWNDNYANRHAVIEIKGTTLTSSIYDGENLISTAVAENIQTPSAGKIVFAVNNEQNTFDNIVVTDLSSNDPVSITPANGTNNVSVTSDVVLTYGKNVTEAMADAVTVSPETSYTPNIDGNTLTLDFDGLEYNTTYTVTSGEFTSSFKTEMNMEDVLFYEDFTDATASLAKFEQYGPNTGTDTFLVKEFWGTKATEGASLNFTGSSNGHKFDINAPRAAIVDSNWSDFRLEFDYTTGPVANSYIMLRMDEDYNGIEVQLGAGNGTTHTYELVNGISTMTAGVAKYDHWGNITYGESEYLNWNDNYANRHAVIEIKGTTLTSSIYDGENLISTAVAENIQTPSAGKIVFATNNGAQNTFDNIVVTDLAGGAPHSITPVDKATDVSVLSDVALTFAKAVTEEVADAVSISPAAAFRKIIDGKTLKLCFTDALEYETTYTITYGDFTASFTTESLSGDVIFAEDFTNATASLAKFEQYGPNTGTDTFYVKDFWGTSATDGASLNFTGSANGHKFDINAPRAAIVDSNWSDFRLEFDYTTGPVANSYIMLRMDEDYNGIEVQLGAGNGTTHTYELVNGISTMTAGVAKYDHWGNITYGESEYLNWNDNYANRHAVIEIKGTTLTSSIYDGDNLISKAVAENIQTPSAGKIVFAVNNAQNTFDNIKIIPIGLEFTPDKIKNVQETISLTFEEALANTNKWDELITITDADGNAADFSTTLNINTGKQLSIILADPKDGEYTITVKKGVEAQSGATTQADKTFKVLVTMPYSITDFAIGNLVAGSKVSADATLAQAVAGEQDYTLVLAIYTNEGRLYDVDYETVTLYDVADSHDFSVTSDLALPSDITGYTAGAWFIDNLTNIKPMSGKITK
ncbi:MAG: hypothetical protein E7412_00065 [Ruminococcaceae bacterium]|nr:hypothetical protein [Oscillospiraceae bacterium]